MTNLHATLHPWTIRAACVDSIKRILCVQDLLNRNDEVLKDDVILGQIVVPAQVRDMTCQLVENSRRLFSG